MARCEFIAKVKTGFDWDWGDILTGIQCANEGGHVGDHLIIVPA